RLARGDGLRDLLRRGHVQRHGRAGRTPRPDGGGDRNRSRPQAAGPALLVLETGPLTARDAARENTMGKARGQRVGVVILIVALALGAGPNTWAAEKVTVGIGGVGL